MSELYQKVIIVLKIRHYCVVFISILTKLTNPLDLSKSFGENLIDGQKGSPRTSCVRGQYLVILGENSVSALQSLELVLRLFESFCSFSLFPPSLGGSTILPHFLEFPFFNFRQAEQYYDTY